MRKKILIIVSIIVVFTLINTGFDLRKTSNRPYNPIPLNKELKERIKRDIVVMDDASSIVRYSCSLTAELLEFSKHNDIPNGKANCIGYAQLSSTICNYAFSIFEGEDASIKKCKARPVVGTVHYLRINLNKLSQSILPHKYRPFFKDHDFMEVDFDGGNVIFVDACLHDYFGGYDL